MKKSHLEILDIYRERINNQLELHLSSNFIEESSKSDLGSIMKYSVLAGGKRFRPILTYTIASLFGIKLEKVDKSACAIELIHIYSLIHDDLPAMDDDDIRHNQPSSHKVFGEAQAILAGDALQALAFKVISSDELLDSDVKVSLLNLLAISSYEMADGQSIDLSIVSKDVDILLLNSMHKKKTGALINCAVNFGVLLNPNIRQEDSIILSNFASKIGLAYQVQDDVLDITTSVDILGKRQNSDAIKRKPSYPSILGLDESIKIYKKLYKEALEEISKLSVNEEQLKDLTKKLMQRSF
ncbi:polyprenyl synthetase family protein [Candidatus Thioglobus sp. NP1]|uniref:polyprenyl synthetase family protein n=1 Tax=Candidatus Thioglobus sp. NP1 TaxID=2508687 RepID=UPI00269E3BF9